MCVSRLEHFSVHSSLPVPYGCFVFSLLFSLPLIMETCPQVGFKKYYAGHIKLSVRLYLKEREREGEGARDRDR